MGGKMAIATKAAQLAGVETKPRKKRDTNSDNPHYHRVLVTENGKTFMKKDVRPVPPGISDNDKEVLRKFRKKAYHWDMWFRIPCTNFRFGLSPIFGIIPVVGDALEVLVSMMMIKQASKLDGGLPKRLYTMMMTNIMLDFAAGFVPILGDIIDLFYRANTRNAWLLEEHLGSKGKKRLEHEARNPGPGNQRGIPSKIDDPDDADVEQGVEMVDSVYATPAVASPAPARTHAAKVGNIPFPSRPVPGGAQLDWRTTRP